MNALQQDKFIGLFWYSIGKWRPNSILNRLEPQTRREGVHLWNIPPDKPIHVVSPHREGKFIPLWVTVICKTWEEKIERVS